MILRPLGFALLGIGAAVAAHGHATSTSYLVVDAGIAEHVALTWDIAVADLHWGIGLDADGDGRITWREIEATRPAIVALAAQGLSLSRGGAACTDAVPEDLLLTDRAGEPYVSLSLTARCTDSGSLEIASDLFFAQDASQRTLLDVSAGGSHFVDVLSPAEPRWLQPGALSWTASFATFLAEGVWHVWIGYDHIAFLLLLLLPSVLHGSGQGWRAAPSLRAVARDVVMIVTAFTLAHSITLGLAATGTVQIPVQPTEVAIAASVIAAGLLNLAPRAARWRLPLAFGFGLVHGFGFANVLAELGSGGARLVPMLTGFNLGVELGQLTVVAIVLPLLLQLRASPFYATRLMPAASIAIAMAGGVWLAGRIT